MKMIKTMNCVKTLLMLIGFCLASTTHGQFQPSNDYKTAVGVRGVGTTGLTVKHFTNSNTAIEGIIGFYPNAFSVTGLVEKYQEAFETRGLNWYYGIGGHIAGQSSVVEPEGGWYRRESSAMGFGIDGIFGIEYKIYEVPIAVSFDFKPFIEIATDGDAFLALDPGLGLKFTF